MDQTYYTGTANGLDTYICCLICGKKSFNPHDIENRYCGHCHIFHMDMMVFSEESAKQKENIKDE